MCCASAKRDRKVLDECDKNERAEFGNELTNTVTQPKSYQLNNLKMEFVSSAK